MQEGGKVDPLCLTSLWNNYKISETGEIAHFISASSTLDNEQTGLNQASFRLLASPSLFHHFELKCTETTTTLSGDWANVYHLDWSVVLNVKKKRWRLVLTTTCGQTSSRPFTEDTQCGETTHVVKPVQRTTTCGQSSSWPFTEDTHGVRPSLPLHVEAVPIHQGCFSTPVIA